MDRKTSRKLTLIPLGPDDAQFLTIGIINALYEAKQLVLRTRVHGAVSSPMFKDIKYETLDDLYEEAETLEELCRLCTERLLSLLEAGDLWYAVPDPVSDATVQDLLAKLPESIEVQILSGVSLAQNVLSAALASASATRLDHVHIQYAISLGEHRVQSEPQIICELNDRMLASEVKLWLNDLYDDDTEILFIENAAMTVPDFRRIPLYDLDRQPVYDHRTAIFVPETDILTRQRASYEDFVRIIGILRSPEGCPWDRAQTHRSLRRYMLEEASEAADALGAEDVDHIIEELGDVLLQVVLNANIGEEHREFTDRDVTSAITRKMIRRHEHVFGNAHAETPEETGVIWEQAKKKEYGSKSALEQVEDLPESLPTLLRVQKMAKRIGKFKPEEVSPTSARSLLLKILGTDNPMTEEQLGACLEALCILAETEALDGESALRDRMTNRIRLLREEVEV